MTSRARLVLVGTLLAVFMPYLDQTASIVTLVDLGDSLGVTPMATHWIVVVYLLAFTAFSPIGGFLADRHGRRRIFMLGTGLFAASSVVVGVAPDLAIAIAGRALQGIGGALAIPSAVALLAETAPMDRRGSFIGLVTTTGAVALSVGPFAGGLLAVVGSWRLVYLVNIPLALVAMALVSRAPNSTEYREGRVDALGAGLVVAALGGITFALQDVSDGRDIVVGVGVPLVVAAVAGAWYWHHQRRVLHPVVPLRMFRNPVIRGASTVTFASSFLNYAATVYVAILVQMDFGWSALVAGIALLPTVVPAIPLARWAGRRVDAEGPRRPASVAMALQVVSAAGLATGALLGNYWVMAVPLLLLGIGKPFTQTIMSVPAIDAVPMGEAGVAAALIATMRNGGGVAGAAVMGAVIAGVAGTDAALYGQGVAIGLAGTAVLCAVATFVAARTLPGKCGIIASALGSSSHFLSDDLVAAINVRACP